MLSRTPTRIGLALGGGAARGLAHVGVIQVLEENGLEVHSIAGTSMGAIVGAVYLMEGDSRRMVARMNGLFQSEAFRAAKFDLLREQREEDEENWVESMTGLLRRGWAYARTVRLQSIIDRDVFQGIINEVVPDLAIEELPKPFAATSLNVVDGNEVIWTSGSLRNALWASSAIPGFFPPLELDGMVLVDGAWTNSVPVGPCLTLGAERVLAVDISREIEEIFEYKRGVNLILRSALLTSKHLREHQLQEADLVLRPDVGHIHWADFSAPEALIQKGRDAALVHLDQVRGLTSPTSPWARSWALNRVRASLQSQFPRRRGRRGGPA